MTLDELEPWFWFFAGFFAFLGGNLARALTAAIGAAVDEIVFRWDMRKRRKVHETTWREAYER